MKHIVKPGDRIKVYEVCCPSIYVTITNEKNNIIHTKEGFKFKKHGIESRRDKYIDPLFVIEVNRQEFKDGDSLEMVEGGRI